MYASRTVCSRCSSHLRSASASAKRLGAAASYSTVADIPDLPKPASTSNSNEPTSQPTGQRRGMDAFKKQNNSDQDPALALFKEIVNPENAVANTKPGSAPIPIMNELEIVARLKDIMARGFHPGEQYKIFQDEIWPSIQEFGGQIPKPIYMATTQLLRNQRDHMFQKGKHPGSVDIAEKYRALGVYDLSIRNDLILNICARTTQQKNPFYVRTELKEELIKMWMHVSQLKRPGEVNKELRFALPTVVEMMKDTQNVKDDSPTSSPTSRALASIFLQFPPPQAQDIIPGLLASLAVMSDRRFSGPAHRKLIAPLLFLVRSVLSKYKLTDADINIIFSQYSSISPLRLTKLKEYVMNQWPLAMAMLTNESTPWAKALSQGKDPGMKSNLNLFHKQLRSAYRGRNNGAIGSIWHNMMTSLEETPGLKAHLADDREFLDFWVFVWCAVRRPERVQDTVDLMHSLGVEPTVRTYTAMMHGWKKCKDISRIEKLWSQLVQSGTKLDAVIWTERVSALIDLGQHQKGLVALVEFVTNWHEAVKQGKQAEAVEPTIETVNAAFKGLLNADPKAAHQLLAWAGKQGLEPNTRTYNILVRETIRMGHSEEVHDLLRSMEKQGIEPDSATFTILLEAVIGRMGDATAEEQVTAVHTVFDDIEQAGLKPNLETYGKVLYALDGLPNCSDKVIAAVQKHMQSKGFGAVLTPHMITILIERALRHDPPNIKKIRSLLKENNLTKVDSGDQTLWERVMTAHAVSGGIQEAMAIFNDLAESGRPVTSLSCLKELIQALLQYGDMESARRVVSVVLAHKLGDKENRVPKDRYWRHHFWYLAQHNGLIDSQTLKNHEGS